MVHERRPGAACLPPLTVVDGMSEAQARVIWYAVAQTRASRFDALAAHAELVAAGYTPPEADTLLQEVIERLTEDRPADRDTLA
jgi:hypothetical protein